MDIRLRPGLRLLHAADEDTTRSAAGRTAAEAIWTPAGLLPQAGVTWHAESDEVIVATWDVPPERPQLRLGIDAGGAVRTTSLMRWDSGQHGLHGYIPCGGHVLQERRFGNVTIPSRVSVGWWYGTPPLQAVLRGDHHSRRAPRVELALPPARRTSTAACVVAARGRRRSPGAASRSTAG
jgi:hypothetical protein